MFAEKDYIDLGGSGVWKSLKKCYDLPASSNDLVMSLPLNGVLGMFKPHGIKFALILFSWELFCVDFWGSVVSSLSKAAPPWKGVLGMILLPHGIIFSKTCS